MIEFASMLQVAQIKTKPIFILTCQKAIVQFSPLLCTPGMVRWLTWNTELAWVSDLSWLKSFTFERCAWDSYDLPQVQQITMLVWIFMISWMYDYVWYKVKSNVWEASLIWLQFTTSPLASSFFPVPKIFVYTAQQVYTLYHQFVFIDHNLCVGGGLRLFQNLFCAYATVILYIRP